MGGISLSTAAQALYHKFKLPYPGKGTSNANVGLEQLDVIHKLTRIPQVLIWSGSTGVGMYAIQLAKLSGAKVVTTAGQHNHELLKKLGADAVFDYKDPDVSKKIREWSGGAIEFALDCISEGGKGGCRDRVFTCHLCRLSLHRFHEKDRRFVR
jgi:NADPH:quinone reductase-like Zn-dependent oxidoreductase